MDVEAKVILPKNVLDKYPNAIGIVCDACQLEYSLDDYQILKNNSKLIYFSFQPSELESTFLLCHDCFFKKVKKISRGNEEVTMTVTSGEDMITMKFTPEEMLPEDYDEDSDDSYLGLF